MIGIELFSHLLRLLRGWLYRQVVQVFLVRLQILNSRCAACGSLRLQVSAADRFVGADAGSDAAFGALWDLASMSRLLSLPFLLIRSESWTSYCRIPRSSTFSLGS